ncbi:YbaK/prolyl-tRNA synthetase associated region [Candidatus Vecturithrix granuli]|uniref:YbaK/prolyl-tRNA synthetase associated region n=1 Tax=Vecturithrix granuli TaxID=1499967 RepID=A0A081C1J1_VECG1|nr:YbaK/prolyl-tRNA synthetase associated region [Candidatus Vecturithrix granuli]
MDIYQFLEKHGISYERFDHPPVFTCEESSRLCPPMPEYAAKTKNLFLRDKKGRRHFLVTVDEEKQVDVKALEEVLGVQKLSFASAHRLEEHLGLTPGAVTMLGVFNDMQQQRVEVIVDKAVWQAQAVRCHPLVNTSTLIIPHSGIERFFKETGHPVQVLDVPAKNSV